VHLSALRLRGFKSFPDAVELRLDPGVAVVVGPNGSGKSNLADAIQWALSSLPPGRVRAQTTHDVLFTGSAVRAGSGTCEVELVLANEDGRLALPNAEISVMRRVRRDGEGEYLLNRAVVRRLDLQEALGEAGLGRDLHCVVTQGNIDEVLLARRADRRSQVEEAAGLGTVKRRRRRAEQKLAHVRADLERAADLERELQSRLGPLRLQATAAERAERLGREVATARLRLLASEAAGARRRRQALAASLGEIAQDRAGHESRRDDAAARRQAAESRLAALAAEQEQASARAWALRGGADRLDDRAAALASRLAEAERDAARERDRGARLAQESQQLRSDAADAARRAEELAAEAAALGPGDEDAFVRAGARAEEALADAIAARRAAAEAEDQATRATTDAARLTARAAEVTGLGEQAAVVRHAADAAERDAVEAAARCEEARAATAEARDRADALRAAVVAARDEALATDERLSAAGAAIGALEELLAGGHGTTGSTARLVEGGAVRLVDLVRAPAGLEHAVAAALGRRTAPALAGDLASAVAMLQAEGAEGASVLVGDRRPAHPAGGAPARGRALGELVELLPGAPGDLLAGVWLVGDPGELEGIRHGVGVTAEGLGFDADRGVAFRGGAGGEAALLEAAARRDALAAELTALEATAAQAREAHGAAGRALTDAEQSEAVAGRSLREAEVAEDAASRATRERRAAATAATEAEGELARVRASLAELEAQAAVLAERRGEAARRAKAASEEHARRDEERRQEAERLAEVRARAAALAERVSQAGQEAGRLTASADRVRALADATSMRAGRLEELGRKAPAVVAVVDAARQAARAAAEPAQAVLATFEQRAGEIAAALAACRGEEAEQAAALVAVQARATAFEIEAAQVEERLGEARRRSRELAEAAGLTVVDAVEPMGADEMAALAGRVERLERRRADLGATNPLARQEYEEHLARAQDVADQVADLRDSLREIRRVIADLSSTIERRFEETFIRVQAGFSEVIETLFPGGRGRLALVRPEAGEEGEDDEPGEAGIELQVQPAGKRITSLQLLSGGERALAALAFLFALMLARPSPFYVLDEVDAALDDANIERFLALIERFRDRAQFVIISHQKRTMDVADVLYGVSMAGDGVSRVLSRRVPEATRRTFQPVA
jgi:chromosome segregation protein